MFNAQVHASTIFFESAQLIAFQGFHYSFEWRTDQSSLSIVGLHINFSLFKKKICGKTTNAKLNMYQIPLCEWMWHWISMKRLPLNWPSCQLSPVCPERTRVFDFLWNLLSTVKGRWDMLNVKCEMTTVYDEWRVSLHGFHDYCFSYGASIGVSQALYIVTLFMLGTIDMPYHWNLLLFHDKILHTFFSTHFNCYKYKVWEVWKKLKFKFTLGKEWKRHTFTKINLSWFCGNFVCIE